MDGRRAVRAIEVGTAVVINWRGKEKARARDMVVGGGDDGDDGASSGSRRAQKSKVGDVVGMDQGRRTGKCFVHCFGRARAEEAWLRSDALLMLHRKIESSPVPSE
jgi:hypothetical protein